MIYTSVAVLQYAHRAFVVQSSDLIRESASLIKTKGQEAASSTPQWKSGTLPTLPSMWVTTCQASFGGDIEIGVACKCRPFTILQSPSLPTPTVTFIDHKLVSELKLKITDFQCSRLHYGSKKLYVLGKISTSVQCIYNGTAINFSNPQLWKICTRISMLTPLLG